MATRMRVKKTTKTTEAGIRVTTTTLTKAPVLEWVLQAAGTRALRAMPEYAATAEDVKPGMFTFAGDFNAARRSPQESVKAKATGLVAGEHDKRIYMYGGILGLIEYKAEKTPVSKPQKDRHALLGALGFQRQAILRATTEEEAATMAIRQVRTWLAANDNGLAGAGEKKSSSV